MQRQLEREKIAKELRGELTSEQPKADKPTEKLEVSFEITDLVVYLRGLINENRNSRDMNIFFSWIDVLDFNLNFAFLLIMHYRPFLTSTERNFSESIRWLQT